MRERRPSDVGPTLRAYSSLREAAVEQVVLNFVGDIRPLDLPRANRADDCELRLLVTWESSVAASGARLRHRHEPSGGQLDGRRVLAVQDVRSRMAQIRGHDERLEDHEKDQAGGELDPCDSPPVEGLPRRVELPPTQGAACEAERAGAGAVERPHPHLSSLVPLHWCHRTTRRVTKLTAAPPPSHCGMSKSVRGASLRALSSTRDAVWQERFGQVPSGNRTRSGPRIAPRAARVGEQSRVIGSGMDELRAKLTEAGQVRGETRSSTSLEALFRRTSALHEILRHPATGPQAHVLEFADSCTEEELGQLLGDLKDIDVQRVNQASAADDCQCGIASAERS